MNLLLSPSRIRIRDFLIDFFGCLVPGFIFTTLITLVLGWPIFVMYISLLPKEMQNKEIFSGDLFLSLKLAIFIFVLVLSYVVGHILFRLEPKLPDERSVWRQRKTIYLQNKPDGAVRFAEGEQKKDIGLLEGLLRTFWGQGFKQGQGPDVQFPYLYLHEYLNQRGLTHLADLIKWEGSKPETHRYRTKAFINILKTRLEFAFPEKCGTIIRNEAHVRLMSSLWYMLFALQWASIAGFVIAFIAAVKTAWCHSEICWYERHFPPLLISGFMIFAAVAVRYTIEKFIHYQRCREIVYVLETAYFASKFGIVSEDGKKIAVPEILEGLQ